jgi:hypothetical protein
MPTPHPWPQHLDDVREDLSQIFGGRLRALVAYDTHFGVESPGEGPTGDVGHAHTMAVVASLTFADLAACAAKTGAWAARHVGTPLLLSEEEFTRSLDAFPLEFASIASHHHLLAGADPFEGLQVPPEDLRRACETQARSHLLHLREGFLESRADPASVAGLIAASVPSFRTLLLNMGRLDGVTARSREALVRHASEAIGVPAALLDQVLVLRRPQDLDPSDALRVYAAYLDAVERLTAAIDRWTAR